MPRDQYSPQADAEPGYCPGFWYQIVAGQVSVGAGFGATNTLRFLPFQIRALVDIVALGVRITTLAVAGNCQLGIYRANGNTLLPLGPPLATTGSIATDLAVNINGVLTQTRVQLKPGLYWFGTMVDNATVAFQTITNSQTFNILGDPTQNVVSASATGVNGHRQYAATYGTWPDLTDPASTAVGSGGGNCLGQFQVAP